ncbi:MAG: amidase [Balneolaceae bacterium]|nr:MAG: amidase [Balneolaceae bacterium]
MGIGPSQLSWFFAGLATASLLIIGIAGYKGVDADGGPGFDEPPFVMHDVDRAQQLFGLQFDEAQRDSMMDGLRTNLDLYEVMREIDLPNHVVPAMQFNVLAAGSLPDLEQRPVDWKLPASVSLPENREELAFYPVEKLAVLIRDRKITSLELTELYLDRIARYDDELMTVVTLTPDLARRQARQADEELARGIWRGPLHGIPYGTKDLLDLAGYPSTWGSEIYRDQVATETAVVIRKLEEAGAVHLAKMSLGELAWGDVWFGGMTRSPWNTEYGSSGSSAGSASATAAGLVAFAIGSETLGSIVSPSTRNGVTGLRPTYDRVSRQGAMALSWSMDKLGPITRSAHDAALVFAAIHGPAERNADAGYSDPVLIHRKTGVFDLPFNYEPDFDFENLKVGYVKSALESDYGYRDFDRAVLEVLESLGAQLVPIELPELPASAIRFILSVEAAAAFDDITRSGRDTMMVRQIKNAWPNVFRTSRFVPAVEYVQANRIRALIMEQMDEAIRGVDVYVSPSFAGGNLLVTNLTGHPSLSVPTGFDPQVGLPTSITFNGHLFDEGTVLALARAYQSVTEHHLRIPPAFLNAIGPDTGD